MICKSVLFYTNIGSSDNVTLYQLNEKDTEFSAEDSDTVSMSLSSASSTSTVSKSRYSKRQNKPRRKPGNLKKKSSKNAHQNISVAEVKAMHARKEE